jgi:uncharacterized protein
MQREDIINYLALHKDFFYNQYHISSIGLFGSYSRNEQTENSDIDLVYLLSENQKLSYYQLFDIEQQLQNHFNKKVELVNFKYMNPIIKFKAEKDIIYV